MRILAKFGLPFLFLTHRQLFIGRSPNRADQHLHGIFFWPIGPTPSVGPDPVHLLVSSKSATFSFTISPFLTRVKKGDFVKERLPIWKKPKHVQDRGRPMELQLIGQKNIPWRCWSARFGNRPMEVFDESEGRKSPNFMGILMIRL